MGKTSIYGKKIEYTKEDILKDAPDFVLIASPYMQDKYVAYEMVRRELDEHPDRFMQYEGNEGYTYVIDLKLVNIRVSWRNAERPRKQ